jgi:ribonuclease R
LDINDEEKRNQLMRILDSAVLDGLVGKKGKHFFFTSKPSNQLVGVISVNKNGEGFVTVEGYDEDFYVAASRMRTALNRDQVAIVPLTSKQKGKRKEAEIVGIIKRGFSRIIGTFEQSGDFAFVVPDDVRIRRDIYIVKHAMMDAKTGQKVVAVLESWDDESLNPQGRIIEVLGYPDEKGVDVLSVAKKHDLHFDFPIAVEKECAEIMPEIPPHEIARRLDFRDQLCFTIDPYDAKDFDDAVSLRILDNGNYLLGVHIADVSYYVKENSELDSEAYKRGTSTYLVDRVIPMLPEKLSNELCSLRPAEDKLTYSVFMEITAKGNIVDYDVVETIIHSKQRFTYEEVQAIVDGSFHSRVDDHILQSVFAMHALSKILTEKRLTDGSIDFNTPETKFKLDDEGHPIECYRKDRLDSHRLVEEFMLLANQTVSRHVGSFQNGNGKKKHEYPFLYRVHDKPVEEKLENFARLLKVFGYHLTPAKGLHQVKPKEIQRIIEKSKGTKENLLIEKVGIRSMAKAEYSPKNIGHFGLAFDYYSHFTSPIRRYPDLIVHRLLKEYDLGMTARRLSWWDDKLPSMARHCSDREKIAVEAERESVKVKQVEFMLAHVGNEYKGIISGVMGFGIFVEITDFLIEGLIHVRDLNDDYYTYDEKNYRLIGGRKKRVYQLGNEVKVRVVKVNREKNEIDFELLNA